MGAAGQLCRDSCGFPPVRQPGASHASTTPTRTRPGAEEEGSPPLTCFGFGGNPSPSAPANVPCCSKARAKLHVHAGLRLTLQERMSRMASDQWQSNPGLEGTEPEDDVFFADCGLPGLRTPAGSQQLSPWPWGSRTSWREMAEGVLGVALPSGAHWGPKAASPPPPQTAAVTQLGPEGTAPGMRNGWDPLARALALNFALW